LFFEYCFGCFWISLSLVLSSDYDIVIEELELLHRPQIPHAAMFVEPMAKWVEGSKYAKKAGRSAKRKYLARLRAFCVAVVRMAVARSNLSSSNDYEPPSAVIGLLGGFNASHGMTMDADLTERLFVLGSKLSQFVFEKDTGAGAKAFLAEVGLAADCALLPTRRTLDQGAAVSIFLKFAPVSWIDKAFESHTALRFSQGRTWAEFTDVWDQCFFCMPNVVQLTHRYFRDHSNLWSGLESVGLGRTPRMG
jgi:hypothetical protein